MSKTVLVTGASGGIGGACARLFAAEGYKVAIHFNKDKTSAEALKAEIQALGGEAVCFCADLTDEKQVENMIFAVEQEFGAVDVLVNNAGVSQQKLFTDTKESSHTALHSNVLPLYFGIAPDEAKEEMSSQNNIWEDETVFAINKDYM